MRKILIAIILLALCLLIPSCIKENISVQINETQNITMNFTGIQISEWYWSKEYKIDIIDILNYDNVERIVNVTTICLDKQENRLDSNDTAILVIPPKNKWTWVPVCPKPDTYKHSVAILEIDREKNFNRSLYVNS